MFISLSYKRLEVDQFKVDMEVLIHKKTEPIRKLLRPQHFWKL